MTGDGLPQAVIDPDGREVVFTEWSWRPISAARVELLDELGAILAANEQPDLREPGPLPGRERFYRRHITTYRVRWLRVVVDFNREAAVVITAFLQRKDPTKKQ